MDIPCKTSFHEWKEKIGRITEMGEQSSRISGCLPDAITATKEAAPCGKKGPHPLTRDQRLHLENPEGTWRECHWEEALWRKYGKDTSEPVPGLWERILSYQVMLRNENAKDAGWGEIDLLAVGATVCRWSSNSRGKAGNHRFACSWRDVHMPLLCKRLVMSSPRSSNVGLARWDASQVVRLNHQKPIQLCQSSALRLGVTGAGASESRTREYAQLGHFTMNSSSKW